MTRNRMKHLCLAAVAAAATAIAPAAMADSMIMSDPVDGNSWSIRLASWSGQASSGNPAPAIAEIRVRIVSSGAGSDTFVSNGFGDAIFGFGDAGGHNTPVSDWGVDSFVATEAQASGSAAPAGTLPSIGSFDSVITYDVHFSADIINGPRATVADPLVFDVATLGANGELISSTRFTMGWDNFGIFFGGSVKNDWDGTFTIIPLPSPLLLAGLGFTSLLVGRLRRR